MKFQVSRHARANIEAIFETILADDPAAAANWIRELDDKLRRIEEFPESGRQVPEFNSRELREVLHGNFRVLYFLGRERQTVVCVIHGARLLKFRRDVEPGLREDV
ncbi:MAG: type II toxin-antitoxin system RelE/ParE family toxin [Planctomycetota bacterium]|nr:type II toxin-antitoxin system RelE/ParE family toxin [Planctomycetota bacterium]